MMVIKTLLLAAGVVLLSWGMQPVSVAWGEEEIRIKELTRLSEARDNSLVGYGIVTGLSGSGDSIRSRSTFQAISNVLLRFGVKVPPDDIRSRNAASVMVTATLPPFGRPGDKIDVNVASIGDARSLLGGTLLLTHLTGPDGKIYALSQGPVSVGGYTYDLNGNLVQKNHPTAAHIPNGATVERGLDPALVSESGSLEFVLSAPDFTTANRIAESINEELGMPVARAIDASRIQVAVPGNRMRSPVGFITQLENIRVSPDRIARVVINERTGTVVAGGDVRISAVSIAHGDLKVSITTEFEVSQPSFVIETGRGVRTQVVPQTTVEVQEDPPITVSLPQQTTVGDLIVALNKVKATSRDMITILQAIKRAGALHAELVIQ